MDTHTLFIVGAGASWDFGLPVGDVLATQIADRSKGLMQGDPLSSGQTGPWLHKHHQGHALRPKMEALRKISERIYPAASIDRLINQNDHDEHIQEMGKVLIADCISEAERAGPLNLDNGEVVNLRQEDISKSWCDVFLKLLVKGEKWTSIDQMLGRNYSVICFNYDRCLERYLISGVQQAFGLSYFGAWEKVYERLNIIHPYGHLGRLPSKAFDGDDGVPFGGRGVDPWHMASEIRTFTERETIEGRTAQIKKTVDGAHRIVFLGFSFEQMNMELMQILQSHCRKVFASAKGINPTQAGEITLRVRHMLSVPGSDEAHTSVKFGFDRDCKQTLNDFYYELTSYLA